MRFICLVVAAALLAHEILAAEGSSLNGHHLRIIAITVDVIKYI